MSKGDKTLNSHYYEIKDIIDINNVRSNIKYNPFKYRFSKDPFNSRLKPLNDESEITLNEMRSELFEYFKFKVDDYDMLKKVILEIVNKKMKSCSYHGYYNFLHNKFKTDIFDRLHYLNIKIKNHDIKCNKKTDNNQDKSSKCKTI